MLVPFDSYYFTIIKNSHNDIYQRSIVISGVHRLGIRESIRPLGSPYSAVRHSTTFRDLLAVLSEVSAIIISQPLFYIYSLSLPPLRLLPTICDI